MIKSGSTTIRKLLERMFPSGVRKQKRVWRQDKGKGLEGIFSLGDVSELSPLRSIKPKELFTEKELKRLTKEVGTDVIFGPAFQKSIGERVFDVFTGANIDIKNKDKFLKDFNKIFNNINTKFTKNVTNIKSGLIETKLRTQAEIETNKDAIKELLTAWDKKYNPTKETDRPEALGGGEDWEITIRDAVTGFPPKGGGTGTFSSSIYAKELGDYFTDYFGPKGGAKPPGIGDSAARAKEVANILQRLVNTVDESMDHGFDGSRRLKEADWDMELTIEPRDYDDVQKVIRETKKEIDSLIVGVKTKDTPTQSPLGDITEAAEWRNIHFENQIQHQREDLRRVDQRIRMKQSEIDQANQIVEMLNVSEGDWTKIPQVVIPGVETRSFIPFTPDTAKMKAMVDYTEGRVTKADIATSNEYGRMSVKDPLWDQLEIMTFNVDLRGYGLTGEKSGEKLGAMLFESGIIPKIKFQKSGPSDTRIDQITPSELISGLFKKGKAREQSKFIIGEYFSKVYKRDPPIGRIDEGTETGSRADKILQQIMDLEKQLEGELTPAQRKRIEIRLSGSYTGTIGDVKEFRRLSAKQDKLRKKLDKLHGRKLDDNRMLDPGEMMSDGTVVPPKKLDKKKISLTEKELTDVQTRMNEMRAAHDIAQDTSLTPRFGWLREKPLLTQLMEITDPDNPLRTLTSDAIKKLPKILGDYETKSGMGKFTPSKPTMESLDDAIKDSGLGSQTYSMAALKDLTSGKPVSSLPMYSPLETPRQAFGYGTGKATLASSGISSFITRAPITTGISYTEFGRRIGPDYTSKFSPKWASVIGIDYTDGDKIKLVGAGAGVSVPSLGIATGELPVGAYGEIPVYQQNVIGTTDVYQGIRSAYQTGPADTRLMQSARDLAAFRFDTPFKQGERAKLVPRVLMLDTTQYGKPTTMRPPVRPFVPLFPIVLPLPPSIRRRPRKTKRKVRKKRKIWWDVPDSPFKPFSEKEYRVFTGAEPGYIKIMEKARFGEWGTGWGWLQPGKVKKDPGPMGS